MLVPLIVEIAAIDEKISDSPRHAWYLKTKIKITSMALSFIITAQMSKVRYMSAFPWHCQRNYMRTLLFPHMPLKNFKLEPKLVVIKLFAIMINLMF